jgi:hypothetical protein
MTAAATFDRHGPSRRYRWFVLLVAVAALVAPARAVSAVSASSSHHQSSDRAHAGDAATTALAETATAKSEVHDRRGAPGGTLPAGILAVLGAFALWSIRRTRGLPVRMPRVAFRRRGPPLLQPAF